jgi:hypothetical protein
MDYDDGGPAFPPGESGPMGMPLRDWFAGQALAALGADMRNWTITGVNNTVTEMTLERVSTAPRWSPPPGARAQRRCGRRARRTRTAAA